MSTTGREATSRWRALVVSALASVASLAFALGLAGRAMWDDALGAIRNDYMYHWLIAAQLSERSPEGPLIVWLGDSTLLKGHEKVAYPMLVTTQLQRGVHSRVVAGPGVDSYGAYFLMGPVLAMRPAAVVIVAHLRFMGDPHARADDPHVTMHDVAAYLAPGDIPAPMRLPLRERHLTVSRLLLAQLLRIDVVDNWFLVLHGLHRPASTRAAGWSTVPGPRVRRTERLLHDAYVEIDAGSPGVRMLAAAVAKARRQDVPVLVIGTPVPVDRLTIAGRVTTSKVAATFRVLGDAVRDAGGTFLDLHAALRTAELRDDAGHFTAAGAARMAALVAPELRRLVSSPQDATLE